MQRRKKLFRRSESVTNDVMTVRLEKFCWNRFLGTELIYAKFLVRTKRTKNCLCSLCWWLPYRSKRQSLRRRAHKTWAYGLCFSKAKAGELNADQTKITHSAQHIRFLGYDVKVRRNQKAKRTSNGLVKRTLNLSVDLLVPMSVIDKFLMTTTSLERLRTAVSFLNAESVVLVTLT